MPSISQTLKRTASNTLVKKLASAWFILYVCIKILFIYSGYDLFSEEAQYWLWSRYPDWSYYSKPPLIAWVNFVTGLLGPHDTIIRITALTFGLASLYIMYRIGLLLFQKHNPALLSAVILSVSPYFILASTFFTTDSLLIFFWLLTGFYFIRALQKSDLKNWILSGLSFGLGCLSKYSMVFFILALVPVLFAKNAFVHLKGAVFFLLTGIILCAPVIYWNAHHEWVTFKHVLALTTHTMAPFSFGKSFVYLGEFAGGILLVNSPFFFYVFIRAKKALKYSTSEEIEGGRKMLWLLLPVAGTVGFFFIVSIFKRTEVNWGAMSYLSLPLVLAYLADKSQSYVTTLRMAAVTFSFVLILLFPRALDGIGFSNLLPVKLDSMKRMAGWKQLADEVMSLQKKYSSPNIIVTDSYHIASEISFYGNGNPVYCINNGRRMNQFDVWQGRDEMNVPVYRALYVTDLSHPGKGLEYARLGAHYTVPVMYRGQNVRLFHIFVLEGFQGESQSAFEKF